MISASASAVEWRPTPLGVKPFLDGRELLWAPPADSGQEAFLTLPPEIEEVNLSGVRGSGKSDVIIAAVADLVSLGRGAKVRICAFRKTFGELRDLVSKGKQVLLEAFPGTSWNEARHSFLFPGGEEFHLGYLDTVDDVRRYKGQEYCLVFFDELTSWATPEVYNLVKASVRSPAGVPLRIVSATNPDGPGHSWVKAYFGHPIPPGDRHGAPLRNEKGGLRVAIRCRFRENVPLATADPGYLDRLHSAAMTESRRKAWIGDENGDECWDGNLEGAFFGDLWRPAVHVVPTLDPRQIPGGYWLYRALDLGGTTRHAYLLLAESDGTAIRLADGRTIGEKKKDVIVLHEFYVSEGAGRTILSDLAESALAIEGLYGRKVHAGPADPAIFGSGNWTGQSPADILAKLGLRFEPADNKRVAGWLIVRERLAASYPNRDGLPRDNPGLFVTTRCPNLIRTLPTLPADPRRPGDVDTTAEDHLGDCLRYALTFKRRTVYVGSF